MLLIGGHGETITIGRIKGLVITLAVVAVTVLAASAVLFYSNRRVAAVNADLLNSLAEMESRLVSLRNDRDLYMARLVAAELRIEHLCETPGEKSIQAGLPETGEKEDCGPEETGPAGQSDGETVAAIENSAPKKDISVAAGQPGIAVENFTLTYESSIQTLKTGYRIKITDHLLERITGRTIVVLKPGGTEHSQWLTLPGTELDREGQPVDWQKGQLFSISNFRDIALKAKSQYPAGEFTLATVFVFSKTGDLLLKKDFPLAGN